MQCQKESARDDWHPPECSHYKSQKWMQMEDKCVFKHTGKASDDKMVHCHSNWGRDEMTTEQPRSRSRILHQSLDKLSLSTTQEQEKRPVQSSKRIELCIERQPRIYVLSTIDSEENWMATNKETFQSATLSQCGETLPYKRKTWTIAGCCSVEIQIDRNPDTPTCEDVHPQWTQHCEEESRIATRKPH